MDSQAARNGWPRTRTPHPFGGAYRLATGGRTFRHDHPALLPTVPPTHVPPTRKPSASFRHQQPQPRLASRCRPPRAHPPRPRHRGFITHSNGRQRTRTPGREAPPVFETGPAPTASLPSTSNQPEMAGAAQKHKPADPAADRRKSLLRHNPQRKTTPAGRSPVELLELTV